MLQLPLFIAFFEAVQRTPAIFEDNFLGLQLGTTPSVGITTGTFYMYALLVLLIAASTYFSFKMNTTGNMQDPSMKMMPYMIDLKKNFSQIAVQCERITELEHAADDTFAEYIGYIFTNESDPIELIKYKNIAETLEAATDAAKRISDTVKKMLMVYLG